VGRLELLLGLKEKGDDLKNDYMKKPPIGKEGGAYNRI